MTTPTTIRLRVNKFIDIVDGQGRPTTFGHTHSVDAAAEKLVGLDQPYLEADFQVWRSDGIPSVEKQVAMYTRRLKKLAAKIGRNVVRVDWEQTRYVAKLAR
jgi:hypothetical protein